MNVVNGKIVALDLQKGAFHLAPKMGRRGRATSAVA
jgi:hypothetical protein